MKYLKLYEAWSKNIKVDDIYVIDEMLIINKGWDKENIRLGKIIKIINLKDYFVFKVKTFLKHSNEEFIFDALDLKHIKRKANEKEILEFELIENAIKYNL